MQHAQRRDGALHRADDVIDYTQQNFTDLGKHYDLIVDMVGNHTITAYEGCLTDNGIVSLVGSSDELRAELADYEPPQSGPRFVSFIAQFNKDDLLTLAGYLETGHIVPVIDRRYQLEETPDALAYLGTKRVRGKLIVQVIDES